MIETLAHPPRQNPPIPVSTGAAQQDPFVSTLIVGCTGSGKTLSTLAKLLWLAINQVCAIVVMDRHGMLARLLALHLIFAGLGRRMLYDRLSSFNRVLPVRILQPSTDPSPFKRDSENHRTIAGFRDMLFSASQRSGDQNIHTMPALILGVEMVGRLIMFQPNPDPSKLMDAFRFESPNCQRLADECRDHDAQTFWRELLRLHNSNSLTLLESKIGSTMRLVRQVALPGFLVRCSGCFSLGEALRQKRIIILDGSDDGSVPPEMATAMFKIRNQEIARHLEQNFAKTGKPCSVLVVWEEAAATNIIGPTEINMMREGRKFGLCAYVLTQEMSSFTPEAKQAAMVNTRRHEWYNPGDHEGAEEAARDVMYPQLDPYQIHEETFVERQLHAGVDFVQRSGISRTTGSDGKQRTTKTQSQVSVPTYHTVRDKRTSYRSLDDQIKLRVGTLLTIGPGWRMVRDIGYVSKKPEYVPLLADPFPEDTFPGLADKKVESAIEQSQAGPEFITPVFVEVAYAPRKPNSRRNGTTTPMRKNATNGRKRF